MTDLTQLVERHKADHAELQENMDKTIGNAGASNFTDDGGHAYNPKFDSEHWQEILIKTGEQDTDLCYRAFRLGLGGFSAEEISSLERNLKQVGIEFEKKTASKEDIVIEDGDCPIKEGMPVVSVEKPDSIVKLRFGLWKETHLDPVVHAQRQETIGTNDLYRIYGVVTTVAEEKADEKPLPSSHKSSLHDLPSYKLKQRDPR